jgi:hypothetical protein
VFSVDPTSSPIGTFKKSLLLLFFCFAEADASVEDSRQKATLDSCEMRFTGIYIIIIFSSVPELVKYTTKFI